MADEPTADDPETPKAGMFTPDLLDRTVIALPLFREFEKHPEDHEHPIVIELNLDYPADRPATRALVQELCGLAGREDVDWTSSEQYVFARMSAEEIRQVVRLNERRDRPIFRIWPDFPIERL